MCETKWILKGRNLLKDEGPDREKYQRHARECNIDEGDRGSGRVFFASAYQALQYCCCDYDERAGRIIELLFLLEVVPIPPSNMYNNSKKQIYTGPARVTKVHVRRFFTPSWDNVKLPRKSCAAMRRKCRETNDA